MSWKKNVFSYLIWFAYTIAVGSILAAEANFLCAETGASSYVGLPCVVIFLLLIGNIVFLFHRFAEKAISFVHKNSRMVHVLEAATAVIFLAAGIIFRVQGMESAGQSSVYYDAAKVAAGQRIPQMVHGAVYFYVRLLHGVFLLTGNHISAGIWLQIFLQLGVIVLLFFGVRKTAGPVASMIVLGICTCAPYMIENALTLSPESLFLCIFIAAAYLLLQKGRIRPERFFLWGILISFCIYMDVLGCWLLLAAFYAIFTNKSNKGETADTGRKTAAAGLCALGTAAGFLAILYVDAFFSEKAFGNVLQAWGMLYAPESFRLPVISEIFGPGMGLEGMILTGLMSFGVFSFWCDKKEEKFSFWAVMAGTIAAAGCWGIFTDEMPGTLYLYIVSAVLAGTGVAQCFSGCAAWETAPGEEKESLKPALEGEKAEEGDGDLEEKPGRESRNPRERLRERREADMETAVQEVQETKNAGMSEENGEKGSRQIKYIENPLPLPKKHEKRVLDYPVQAVAEKDDFDYPVSDEDDFDI